MKKRFTEEQIIGFLREAEAGMPVAELCRKHAFPEASYYLWRDGKIEASRCLIPELLAARDETLQLLQQLQRLEGVRRT